jgi:hypothetical protein
MFLCLIKKRTLQPGLPTRLHSLMRSTIIVPSAHYVCSAACSIFVVTFRESLAGKGRGQGAEAPLPSLRSLNPCARDRFLARQPSSGWVSPAWRASHARAAWSP